MMYEGYSLTNLSLMARRSAVARGSTDAVVVIRENRAQIEAGMSRWEALPARARSGLHHSCRTLFAIAVFIPCLWADSRQLFQRNSAVRSQRLAGPALVVSLS